MQWIIVIFASHRFWIITNLQKWSDCSFETVAVYQHSDVLLGKLKGQTSFAGIVGNMSIALAHLLNLADTNLDLTKSQTLFQRLYQHYCVPLIKNKLFETLRAEWDHSFCEPNFFHSYTN